MSERGPIECWLTDMDGVLVHEGSALPGAADFLAAARRPRASLPRAHEQLDLHPARPRRTPRPRRARTCRRQSIWTSALATADFLSDQMPGGSAYVIGEAGLTTALYEAGYTLTDTDPDFVVLGETRTYSFEAITTAIRLVDEGRPVHRDEPRRHRPVRRRARCPRPARSPR